MTGVRPYRQSPSSDESALSGSVFSDLQCGWRRRMSFAGRLGVREEAVACWA